MPWSTLGLEEESASERDVKRAYARLLKQHRPDRDPEGFARIHEAYQRARQELTWRKLEQEAEAFESDSSNDDTIIPLASATYAAEGGQEQAADPGFPEAPVEDEDEQSARFSLPPGLPEVFVERNAALSAALPGGDEGEISDALSAFNAVCIDRPECIPEWGQAVFDHFPDQSQLLSRIMPIGDLMRELEYEGQAATHAVINGWEENFDLDSMMELANEIMGSGSRYNNEAAARVCIRLAYLLALNYPTISERLANHAFASLPPGTREWITTDIDQSLAAGRLFARLPDAQKRFWAQRLNAPDKEWDWNTMESVLAMNYLRENVGDKWEGYQYINELVPDDLRHLIRPHGGFRRAEPMATASHGHERREHKSSWSSSDGGGGGSNWVVWVVGFLVFKFFIISTQCDDNKPNPVERFEHIEPLDPNDFNDRMKDILKNRKFQNSQEFNSLPPELQERIRRGNAPPDFSFPRSTLPDNTVPGSNSPGSSDPSLFFPK